MWDMCWWNWVKWTISTKKYPICFNLFSSVKREVIAIGTKETKETPRIITVRIKETKGTIGSTESIRSIEFIRTTQTIKTIRSIGDPKFKRVPNYKTENSQKNSSVSRFEFFFI